MIITMVHAWCNEMLAIAFAVIVITWKNKQFMYSFNSENGCDDKKVDIAISLMDITCKRRVMLHHIMTCSRA